MIDFSHYFCDQWIFRSIRHAVFVENCPTYCHAAPPKMARTTIFGSFWPRKSGHFWLKTSSHASSKWPKMIKWPKWPKWPFLPKMAKKTAQSPAKKWTFGHFWRRPFGRLFAPKMSQKWPIFPKMAKMVQNRAKNDQKPRPSLPWAPKMAILPKKKKKLKSLDAVFGHFWLSHVTCMCKMATFLNQKRGRYPHILDHKFSGDHFKMARFSKSAIFEKLANFSKSRQRPHLPRQFADHGRTKVRKGDAIRQAKWATFPRGPHGTADSKNRSFLAHFWRILLSAVP